MKTKSERRAWRKQRIRKKVHGSAARPRLSVFRSAAHIYAQVIDDDAHQTIVATSSLAQAVTVGGKTSKIEVAKKVGALIAQGCKEKNISQVIFDRNGFVYHGRVKALAEGAREAGLEF